MKTTNGTPSATSSTSHVSIGDVAVAPSDPNVVWVGTGENNPPLLPGDCVYKSTDGK